MPHATQDVQVSLPQKKAHLQPKLKALPRELLQITSQLLYLRELYTQSQLPQSIGRQLHTITKTGQSITRIVSLGLGSLLVVKGQSRRLKQLAILLAIRDHLQDERQEVTEVYAQDPTFTRLDERLLSSFDIRILRTASASDLGEAASFVSPSTLVYSPFLTLEAYEQLFVRSSVSVRYLVGDDFNALLQKWPKRSAERRQVEDVVKLGLTRYRRKAISGEGFWSLEDETFPMAIYTQIELSNELRAKI